MAVAFVEANVFLSVHELGLSHAKNKLEVLNQSFLVSRKIDNVYGYHKIKIQSITFLEILASAML